MSGASGDDSVDLVVGKYVCKSLFGRMYKNITV